MVIPMYLNILEYIDDETEQKNLTEEINLTGEARGVFAQLREEGKRELLESQLENCSIDELSQISGIGVCEIRDILNRDF